MSIKLTFKYLSIRYGIAAVIVVPCDNWDVSVCEQLSTFPNWARAQNSKEKGRMGGGKMQGNTMKKYHPEAIPFKGNGDKLIPLFGDSDNNRGKGVDKTILKPDQSITLTFNGIIQIHSDG